MAGISNPTAKKKKKGGPGRPFEKGQSGNPSGRKPVPPEVREKIHQIMQKGSVQAAQRLLELAMDDDKNISLKACIEVLNRHLGKPVAHLDAKISKADDLTDDEIRSRLRGFVHELGVELPESPDQFN